MSKPHGLSPGSPLNTSSRGPRPTVSVPRCVRRPAAFARNIFSLLSRARVVCVFASPSTLVWRCVARRGNWRGGGGAEEARRGLASGVWAESMGTGLLLHTHPPPSGSVPPAPVRDVAEPVSRSRSRSPSVDPPQPLWSRGSKRGRERRRFLIGLGLHGVRVWDPNPEPETRTPLRSAACSVSLSGGL